MATETNRPLPEDENVERQVDLYVGEVARRLGYPMDGIPPMVRSQIERCGQHGLAADEASWSVRDWLEGRFDE